MKIYCHTGESNALHHITGCFLVTKERMCISSGEIWQLLLQPNDQTHTTWHHRSPKGLSLVCSIPTQMLSSASAHEETNRSKTFSKTTSRGSWEDECQENRRRWGGWVAKKGLRTENKNNKYGKMLTVGKFRERAAEWPLNHSLYFSVGVSILQIKSWRAQWERFGTGKPLKPDKGKTEVSSTFRWMPYATVFVLNPSCG